MPLQCFLTLFLLSILALASSRSAAAESTQTSPGAKLRVLLVHGGHDFETNQFFQVFQANPEITLRTVAHPAAHSWFKQERAQEYDVLVLYDMWQTISEEAKSDLMALLRAGKPLVALHHSLVSYQRWPEYADIIGGRYHLEKWIDQGSERAASTYKHDVNFTIHIADPTHPITQGLTDFMIRDETYGGFEVKPESHVLLTTDAATSGRKIAWCKEYGAARVVYIQLGHDHQAYENLHYQRLLVQAIRWVARRS